MLAPGAKGFAHGAAPCALMVGAWVQGVAHGCRDSSSALMAYHTNDGGLVGDGLGIGGRGSGGAKGTRGGPARA